MAAVHYEVTGRTARITIDRPTRRNAMDPAAYREFHACTRRFEEDDRAAVALISATGADFTVGGDMQVYAGKSVQEWRQGEPDSPSIAQQAHLWQLSKPVVAAVQGLCVGWGMTVLLASDVRLVGSDARLGFTNLAFFGGASTGGYLERLFAQVPYVRAAEIALTGRLVPAEEAARYDLVTEVCDPAQLAARAQDWVDRLLRTPPAVLQTVKLAGRRLQDELIGDGFGETERRGLEFLQSADFEEAFAAWRERRAPQWADPASGGAR